MPDLALSGLVARPNRLSYQQERGLILALHGGSYSAGYWHCPADGASLLELGAHLGFHVLALDRPGYGLSQNFDPSRLGLSAQVDFLFDAMDAWAAATQFEGPRFVIGHSIGGILALLMAAHPRAASLRSIDVLGVPIHFANTESGNEVQSWPTAETHVPILTDTVRKSLLFGPPETYSAEAYAYDCSLPRPMPVAEYREAIAIPGRWQNILPAIHIPVQFTCAEFEAMQVVGAPVLAEVGEMLSGCGHRALHMLAATGHNASLHRIARAYHLRAIAFFEECLALQAGSAEKASAS